MARYWKLLLVFLVNVATLRKEIVRVARRCRNDGSKKLDVNMLVDESVESLLLRWSQGICSIFDVRVKDWASSFADGRVVCLLLHYYLPSILSKEMICDSGDDQTSRNYSLVCEKIKVVGFVPPILARWTSKTYLTKR